MPDENCPKPCNELSPEPDMGCLNPIFSSCVFYNGEDILCSEIISGQNISEIIEQLGSKDCELQEQINLLENFACEDLNTCSINDLGDVSTNPSIGDLLIFNGTHWVNGSISIPNAFNCSDLLGCSLNDLGNVLETTPIAGDILVFDGTNWVNQTISSPVTADNGLTKTLDNIQLGGDLIKDTFITGENFNLTLGTNTSSVDKLNAYTNSLNIRSTLFSLNESDETTQTKGFRFETNKTSIAIGTDVFNNFNIEDCFRIGNNITIVDSILLPDTEPKGIYIGKNINNINSGIGVNGFGIALGEDIDLNVFVGAAIGKNISAVNFVGGFLLGTSIDLSGFGSSAQAAFVFGNNTSINYATSIQQSTLVFNPSSADIISSSTGIGTKEKIKTDDIANKIITVFNSDEYYFFTNISNDDGWMVNNDLFKITQKYIRVPRSTGSPLDVEEGCIRFNSNTLKYQGYVGGSWVDFH